METFAGKKTEGQREQLIAQGEYSSVTNCPTEIPVILQGIFGIVHNILKYLCV
jgi:hypothetical protein